MIEHQRIRLIFDSFIHAKKADGSAPDTLAFYRGKIEFFLRFCEDAGIQDIEEITPDIFRRFMLALEDRGHSPGGRHCYYRAVKTFLRWYEVEYEPDTWREPSRKVKPPKVDIEPLAAVDIDTVKALLGTCNDTERAGARDRAIILALLDTGARRGELARIDLADVDIDQGTILLRHTKTRKARTVYFGKLTKAALRRWLKLRGDLPGPLFLTKAGSRVTGAGLHSILQRRARLAGVKEPGVHSFRRAYAIQAWRGGLDAVTIGRLLGHSSLEVTKRYLRFETQDLQAAALKVSPGDLVKKQQ